MDIGPAPSVRSGRRLSDKILVAFHHACDEGDLEVAEKLLGVVSLTIAAMPSTVTTERRRSRETLIAGYERLWYLKHRLEGDARN